LHASLKTCQDYIRNFVALHNTIIVIYDYRNWIASRKSRFSKEPLQWRAVNMSGTDLVETMKERSIVGFGSRLAAIRKERGITQAQLGEKVGVSNRVIAYYETESDQPPGSLLVDLCVALKVSADELLGIKTPRERRDPKTARLINRLKRVAELPPAQQRAVLQHLDGLLAAQKSAKRSRSKAS
jgi:transcriptional regulator with XRE-family HTH domain